jgi:hypothetical protein
MTPAALPEMIAAPDRTARDVGQHAESDPGFEVAKMPRPKTVRAASRVQAAIAALRQTMPVPEPFSLADLPAAPASQDVLPASKDSLAMNSPDAGDVVARTGALTRVLAEAVVMASTPSGIGDPDTIVCRAPQRLGDSDQFGPKICQSNRDWLSFTAHGRDLAPDGKTAIDRQTVENPKGEGDPNAVTCRTPQYVTIFMSGPARRGHMGPEVCQTNQFWAALITKHLRIDETGAVVPGLGYLYDVLNTGIGSWGDVGGGVPQPQSGGFEMHK